MANRPCVVRDKEKWPLLQVKMRISFEEMSVYQSSTNGARVKPGEGLIISPVMMTVSGREKKMHGPCINDSSLIMPAIDNDCKTILSLLTVFNLLPVSAPL
ncbi:hypothetical protein HNY73_013581 [Argiope bruennichi]|uniref:Uncharacterized protein n=1 Tax=Argiope bruennichi TaxID=94029 RepID=A0A8T0F3C9_ARGBR|nr:hypothetical protein HNY73_013581 [Argiope bruennichi]